MSLVNFDNIKAAEVQLKLDTMWKDPQFVKNYGIKANTVKTILEQQTATLTEVEDPEKKRDVAIKWVDFCGDTSEDATDADDCNNTAGTEGTAKTQSLALDTFIEDKFTVSEEELETAMISYEEIVATGFARTTKNIIEKFNKKAVATLIANKGVNPYPGNYAFNATTKDTTVTFGDYGAEKLVPYFMQVKELNRSMGSTLLDGGQLFQDFYLAGKKYPNADGKLDAGLYDDLPFRHDLPGFAANSLGNYSFLIDNGSLAIANRSKWQSLSKLASSSTGMIHTSNGSLMRYSMPINIPGLMPMTFVTQGGLKKQNLSLDVQYAIVCDTDGVFKPTWKLKLRAGVFVNPIRCDAGNTGILSFVKGAAPTE